MGHISKLSEHLMVIIYLQPMCPQLEVIQDFSEGGAIPKGGANLAFSQIFPKNCLKMKKIGPGAFFQKLSV